MAGRKPALPDGWSTQAFRFKLEPDTETAVLLRRHCGMRRKAHNWAVGQMKAEQGMWSRRDAAAMNLPELRPAKLRGPSPWFSLRGLRKRWNQVKNELCVDADTGEVWWRELSKEAAANGIDDAVTAYWNWVSSCQGVRKGPRLGFPKFKKKGRCRESFRISTGTIKLTDRRHIQLPRLGIIRLGENARRLDRLVNKDLAQIKAATVTEEADGFYVSLQTDLCRPQRHHQPAQPESKIGIDLGTRKFAVIAAVDGTILERVEHPEPLKAALKKLRRLQRSYARSRTQNPDGSNRQTILKHQISRTHADIKAIRRDFMHKLTTRLAKTHGTIVIEDLNVKGMLRKAEGCGGQRRRREMADAALGEFRRQITYKCGWYRSTLILADRWFPSSQLCHVCGHRQKLSSAETWTCHECTSTHDRDDNAAINLARYVPNPEGGWTQEGAQQSCGCAAYAKRLRGSKTNPPPSLTGPVDAHHTGCAGSPTDTRRTLIGSTPRRGAQTRVQQNTTV